MKRMIRFELRKILPRRKAIVLLILIACFDCVVFGFTLASHQGDFSEARDELTKWRGNVVTNRLIDQAAEKVARFQAKGVENLTEEETAAYNALEFPLAMRNSDRIRKEDLAGFGIHPKDLVLGDTMSYGVFENFIHTYLPFMMTALVAFLLAPVFCGEYDEHTWGLLRASYGGPDLVVRAKILAGLLSTAFLFLAAVGIYGILTLVFVGTSDLKASFVFTGGDIFNYLGSPFDFTVSQFVPLLILISLLGCLGFAAFVFFLSAVCRKPLAALGLGFLIGIMPYFLYLNIGTEHSTIVNLLRLSPVMVMNVKTLFTCYSTIGGIRTVYVSILLMGFSIPVWLKLAAFIYNRHGEQA